jgi:hypothetical protein
MVLLSRDGAAKVGHQLAAMRPADVVFAVPELADVKTSAGVKVVDPRAAPVKLAAGRVSLYCVARALKELGVIPLEALEAAATQRGGERSADSVETIRLAMG